MQDEICALTSRGVKGAVVDRVRVMASCREYEIPKNVLPFALSVQNCQFQLSDHLKNKAKNS